MRPKVRSGRGAAAVVAAGREREGSGCPTGSPRAGLGTAWGESRALRKRNSPAKGQLERHEQRARDLDRKGSSSRRCGPIRLFFLLVPHPCTCGQGAMRLQPLLLALLLAAGSASALLQAPEFLKPARFKPHPRGCPVDTVHLRRADTRLPPPPVAAAAATVGAGSRRVERVRRPAHPTSALLFQLRPAASVMPSAMRLGCARARRRVSLRSRRER